MSVADMGNEPLENLRCLRCEGEMVAGWVPEHIGSGTSWYPLHLQWRALKTTSDPVEKRESLRDKLHRVSSLSDLLHLELTPGLQSTLRDGIPVITMRCVRCGYLEAYARPNPAKPGTES